jgi:hypothetical protein
MQHTFALPEQATDTAVGLCGAVSAPLIALAVAKVRGASPMQIKTLMGRVTQQ